MEIPKIERYVSDLLTVSGFSEEGAEHHLWVLLHHLYSAVAMYEQLSDDDKAVVAETQKKLKYFFETKCNLKDRKRKKTEKESLPPPPPSKEKENKKEKVEKTSVSVEREDSGLDDDQLAFWEDCRKYIGKKYSEEMVQSFFYYWAEKDDKSGKMLWETKKTWNIRFRLAGWSKRSYARNDEMAAIRYHKTKKKQAEETTTAEQQESIAAERQLAQQKLEQQQEESKQGAVSYEEWLRMRKNKKD